MNVPKSTSSVYAANIDHAADVAEVITLATDPVLPPALNAPSARVKVLHTLLVNELNLASPLGEAVGVLERAEGLGHTRATAAQAAQGARVGLARAIASGERVFDAAAVEEYGDGDLWVGSDDVESPSSRLRREVIGEAESLAAFAFVANAAAVFDALAAEARRIVGVFEGLPEPPAQLWASADAAGLLAGSPEHQATLSAVLGLNGRFDRVQRGSDLVRDASGNGFERVADGAPRSALVYRRWRLVEERRADMTTTAAPLRLWRAVLDGWQPGVWRPKDIMATADDARFSTRLRRFGVAVAGGFGS